MTRFVSRQHLLGSCAIALSLVTSANAQNFLVDRAFQGDSTSSGVEIVRGPTVDTITLSQTQTVIDWVPRNGVATGTIDFLPVNTTANFVGPTGPNGPPEFIVLNRVIPTDSTRAISINGTVNSNFPNSEGPSGGAVWFYSPGGIVVGSTARFNVGNLVLSTAELRYDPDGAGLFTNGSVAFGSTANPARATSAVSIASGAQINLVNAGSYLAVVSPNITQGGTVNVNGSAAYIAAERANVTINAGLFNINFATGGQTLVHTGTTTGPAQVNGGAITFAAVAKNSAISALLSGTIGYQPATVATNENGQVVLLGGYTSQTSATPDSAGLANITLGGAGATNFTSTVTARTNGNVTGASNTAVSTLNFARNVSLSGEVSAKLGATNGGVVTVAGDLALTSRSADGSTGGTASLYAQAVNGTAATVTVARSTTLNTNGNGALVLNGAGGTGTGGTSSIIVEGSTMTLSGTTALNANGTGGNGSTNGGSGRGGTASIAVTNAAGPGLGLTATGLTLSANGIGSEYGYGAASLGGAGTGGSATMSVDNARLTAGAFVAGASGYGGYAGTGGVSGAGTGGTTGFSVSRASVVQLDSVSLVADGASRFELFNSNPAFAATGGVGTGGTVNVDILGGTTTIGNVSLPGSFTASANGAGGRAISTSANAGRVTGSGTGGAINVSFAGGALTTSLLTLNADGSGGLQGEGVSFGTSGGAGNGGRITVGGTSGSLTAPIVINANGRGASGFNGQNGGNGGTATGGNIAFTAGGANFTSSSVNLNAFALGGAGGSAAEGFGASGGNGGNGGSARGGSITFDVSGGTSSFGEIDAESYASAGRGGDAQSGSGALNVVSGIGGNGIGGSALLNFTGGVSNVTRIQQIVNGSGGEGGFSALGEERVGTATSSIGGTGTGGVATLGISSAVNNLSSVIMYGFGQGGSGGDSFGGQGGAGNQGIGGTTSLTISGVSVGIDSFDLQGTGQGGSGGFSTGLVNGSAGGAATGGAASFTLSNGATLSAAAASPTLSLTAAAFGGEGGSAGKGLTGGQGGDATGGRTSVVADGSVLDVSNRGLSFSAYASAGAGGRGGSGFGDIPGNGGSGGNGGSALGGAVTLTATGANAVLALGNASFGVGVDAYGGSGGAGGQGASGEDGLDGQSGEGLGVSGTDGGDGSAGFNGGRGGNGGIGTAGTLTIEATNQGSFTAGDVTFAANGVGGDSGLAGFGGRGGSGGNGGSGSSGDFGENGANGGNGGDGGAGGNSGALGNVGYGVGGNVVISANGGSVVTGNLTVTATGSPGFSNTTGGEGGSTSGPGGFAGVGGNGGQAGFPTEGGTVGDAGLIGSNGSAGPEGLGPVLGAPDPTSLGGRISFLNNGPTMSFASLTATAGSSDAPGASGAIDFTLSSALTVTNAVTLDGAAIGIAATGRGALLAGGDVTITAGDLLTLSHATPVLGEGSPSFTTLGGNNVSLTAGSVSGAGSSIVAAGNLSVQADNGIALGQASAGSLLTLNTAAGDIGFGDLVAGSGLTVATPGAVTGMSARLTNGALSLRGDSGITVATVVSGGSVALLAPNGAVSVGTNLSSTGQASVLAQSVLLRAAGALNTQSIIATGGNVDVQAAGNLTVGDTQASGSVSLASVGGDLAVGTIGGASALVPTSVTLSGAGSTVLSGTVVTSGDLGITSGSGATTINGIASGRTVSISSPDIVLGSGARVGTAGTTTQVTFTNNSTATTTIGGSGTTSGYVIDNAELQRVAANGLTIRAPFVAAAGQVSGGQGSASISPNTAPNVILDTLSLAGGANGAFAGGVFRIETPGKLRVVGPVTLTNLSDAARFEIVANDAIEAVPTGSITMTGTNGALAGTLALTTADIFAGSAAALSDVAGLTNLTAISDRLAINDGPVSDNGYFAAGGIVATVSGSVFIQNSGATTAAGTDFDARRGFTVGGGGFTIVQSGVATGSAPIRIAVNGRQVNPATGGYFTGLELVSRVAIVGTGQVAARFDRLSTINGCSIVTATCGEIEPPLQPVIPVEATLAIARDTIEYAGDQFATAAQLLPVALVQFQDFKGFIDQPLIDEPVTGSGNDDLYSLDDSQLCEPGQKPPCK